MVKALTALRKIVQISNTEDTPGAAEAATEALLCEHAGMYSDVTFHYPEDDRGISADGFGNEFAVQRMVELTLNMAMNQRHAPWVFSNAIRGNVTPTQPDSTNEPNAHLWTFQKNLTATNTPDITNGIDTYTIEYGDNIDDYESPYCFATSVVLTGAPGEPVKLEWNMTGAVVSAGITPTPALTVQDVQYFPSNAVNFYIDTSYANIGNTAKTDLLKAWTWTLETTFTPRFTASSSTDLTFTGLNEGKMAVNLELSYVRGTLSEVEKALWEVGNKTYLRIRLLGPTELDSSQSNPPRIDLDGAFTYREWPEADDEDGARIENVVARSVYDSTGTRDFEVAVFTDLATLP